jgi:dethiobiotin synthetase
MRLVVCGTDTDVGKTAVAVALVRGLVRDGLRSGLRVGVYKPVASGWKPDDANGDALQLWDAAGRPLSLEAVCPQSFPAPISPPREPDFSPPQNERTPRAKTSCRIFPLRGAAVPLEPGSVISSTRIFSSPL